MAPRLQQPKPSNLQLSNCLSARRRNYVSNNRESSLLPPASKSINWQSHVAITKHIQRVTKVDCADGTTQQSIQQDSIPQISSLPSRQSTQMRSQTCNGLDSVPSSSAESERPLARRKSKRRRLTEQHVGACSCSNEHLPSASQDRIQQELARCQTFQALLNVVSKYKRRFEKQHAVSTLEHMQRLSLQQQLASFKRKARQLVSSMYDHILREADQLTVHDCCQILLSAPWLPYRDQSIIQISVARVQPYLPGLRPGQTADLMWALQSLQHKLPPAWGQAWFAATELHIKHWNSRQLTTAVHSCRMLGLRPPASWLQKHVTRVRSMMHSCSDQELALVVEAYGFLGCRPSSIWLGQLEEVLLQKLASFSPAAFAGVIRGLGMMRYTTSEVLLQRFYTESLEHLPGFTPKQLVHMLHGVSHTGARPAGYWMTAVMIKSKDVLDKLNMEDLSTLLYHLAHLRYVPSRPWLLSCMSAVQAQAPYAVPRDVVNIVYGFAKLGLQPRKSTLESLLRHSQDKLVLFSSEEQADLLFGLARLRHVPTQEWLTVFFQHSVAKLESSRPQLLLNFMRAVTKLQLIPSLSWFSAFATACQLQLSGFGSREAEQLYLELDGLSALVTNASASSTQQYKAGIEELQAALERHMSGVTDSLPCDATDTVQSTQSETAGVGCGVAVALVPISECLYSAGSTQGALRKQEAMIATWTTSVPLSVRKHPQTQLPCPDWAATSYAVALTPSIHQSDMVPAPREAKSGWERGATLVL